MEELIDRRSLLRRGARGALGLAAVTALGACSNGTSRRAAPGSTTTTAATATVFAPPPVDPARALLVG